MAFQVLGTGVPLICIAKYYRIGCWFSLTVYCLSRQLTAPFFRESAIADRKPKEIRAPLKGDASAYAGLSNTPSLHWTAVVAIINAIAVSWSPSKTWKETLLARAAAGRYGKNTNGANRIKKTAVAIM